MTAENRPSHHLAQNIPWPTEVTIDDLAKINRSRQEGRSLAASVAQTIINEGKALALNISNDPGSPDDSVEEVWNDELMRTRTISNIRSYAATVWIILETEQTLRGGQSIVGELIADFHGEAVEEVMMSEDRASIEAVRDVGWELKRKEYERVLREKGPEGLVDYYTDYGINNSPRVVRNEGRRQEYIEALQKGRQRFHQLYQAAQS